MAFGVLAGVVDGGDLAAGGLGVVLMGVEADLVAIGVVQVRQDPADAGPVHPGVLLAQGVQPGGEPVDRAFVRHANGEVVKAGSARARVGSSRSPSDGPPLGCASA